MRRVLTACFVGIVGPVGLVSAVHAAAPVNPSDEVDRIFAESLPGNRTPAISETVQVPAPPAQAPPTVPEAKSPPLPALQRQVTQGSISSPQVERIKAAMVAPEAKAPAPAPAPVKAETPPPAPAPQPAATGPVRRVNSTAYCLTGRMASGRNTYWGAAAMNGVPLGSRYRVLDGPRAGQTMVIEDRIGHSSGFDIAYPGNCGAARNYGRRTISIQKV